MKEDIRRRTGFPGVVGMMDGMLVTVTAPAVQKERYFDRHHQYSYNVLLVCDNDLVITFAYVGEVGVRTILAYSKGAACMTSFWSDLSFFPTTSIYLPMGLTH